MEIQTGMHIEGKHGEYEIRCMHRYQGFLTICTYKSYGESQMEEYWPILAAPEVTDEKYALEVQLKFWESQQVNDEGLRSILKPSFVRVKEIPELTLWTISRFGVPHIGHDMQLLYDVQLINSIILPRK